jgi:molybdate transport system ATP-binding protein
MFDTLHFPRADDACSTMDDAPSSGRTRTGPVVAAVVYGPEDDVDAALAFCVDTLTRAGLIVGGLLQRFGAPIAPGKREMLLRVLPGHETIRLNDPRGSGVQGCILDTDALARAAMAFSRAAHARPDLLLASRFGKEEAAGGGMRAELAEALLAGVPVLVPVRRGLLPAWREFMGYPGGGYPAGGYPAGGSTGGAAGDELPPTTNAILLWAGAIGAETGASPMTW